MSIDLAQFMSKTSVYENLPVPFSPALRRATWWGIGLCGFSFLVYLLMFRGWAGSWDAERVFLVLGNQFNSIVSWIESISTLLVTLGLLGFIGGLALVGWTHGLKQGTRGWHVVAFVVVAMGFCCALPFIWLITIGAINLIVGIVMGIVMLVFGLAAIALIMAFMFGAIGST